MEFFRTVNIKTTDQNLQRLLTLGNLEAMSTQMFNLEEVTESESTIGGIWGEFTLNRTIIKGGVRFSLLECPNALCWTITAGYPPDPESIVIHLTINRREKDQEFIEEINEFLEDMCLNLEQIQTLSK